MVVLITVAWMVPTIYFTSKLRPTTKPEQSLSENHPFQKAVTTINQFSSSSENAGIEVFHIWGLKVADRTDVNLLMDSKNTGKVRYNENFKFNAVCQDKMEVFQDLKIRNNTQEYLDSIQRNKLTPLVTVCLHGDETQAK